VPRDQLAPGRLISPPAPWQEAVVIALGQRSFAVSGGPGPVTSTERGRGRPGSENRARGLSVRLNCARRGIVVESNFAIKFLKKRAL
jgi:hypothetical protein